MLEHVEDTIGADGGEGVLFVVVEELALGGLFGLREGVLGMGLGRDFAGEVLLFEGLLF